MASIAEGPIKLVLEQPDGTVYELTGHVSEFMLEQEMPVSLPAGGDFIVAGYSTYTASFTVVGEKLQRFLGREWDEEIEERETSEEWVCDWCRSVNLRKHRHCTQCGGTRSFTYG